MAAEHERTKPRGFFQKIAENDTSRKIAVAVGIIGIILIAISGSIKSITPQKNTQNTSSQVQSSSITAEEYEKRVERDLTEILSQVSGVGNVRVLVTLEQTSQRVYATQGKTSGQQTSENEESGTGKQETTKDNETSYLLIKDADGSENALPITEIQPVVKGVVIVCDGGGSPKVQKDITDAVTTALRISSTQVCVIKAK